MWVVTGRLTGPELPWLSSSSEEISNPKVQRQLQVLKKKFFDFITKNSKDFPSESEKGKGPDILRLLT